MRILIIYHFKEYNSECDLIFYSLLQRLVEMNYTVSLFDVEKVNRDQYKSIDDSVTILDKLVEGEWDIIITNINYDHLKFSYFIKGIPSIFLCLNNDDINRVVFYKELYRIIVFKRQLKEDLQFRGIPEELIVKLQYPIGKIQNKFLDNGSFKKKILYIFSKNTSNNQTLFNAIQSLNSLSDYDITILCDKDVALFDEHLNANVSIRTDLENLYAYIYDAGIVITSGGFFAYNSINYSKPVIIVGKNGFGGLINQNIMDHQIETDFSGRIGGYLNEYIPPDMLFNEIEDLAEDTDSVQSIINRNHDLLKKLYIKNGFEIEIKKIFKNVVSIRSSFEDKNSFMSLSPKLSSSISIQKGNQDFSNMLLIRIPINKLIATIDIEMVELLKLFTGEITISDIIKYSGYEGEENQKLLLENILLLWNEKILVV